MIDGWFEWRFGTFKPFLKENPGLFMVKMFACISKKKTIDPGGKGSLKISPKKHRKHLDVSKYRGTPKWMVYNEKPYENG